MHMDTEEEELLLLRVLDRSLGFLRKKTIHQDEGVLGGGFKYFLFSTLFGEDEPILTHIF